jgi:hypothetical protein
VSAADSKGDAAAVAPADRAARSTGRLDRAVKVVWLAIGVLVLVGLAIAGVSVLLSFMQSGGEPDASQPAAREAHASTGGAALRYDAPRPIRGVEWRLMPVRRTSDLPDPGSSSGTPSRALVNAIFLAPGGQARLLLDRPAFIRSIDLPGESADSARGWIAYEIAFRDTDRDGRLGPGDRAELYVSAPDGTGLRPVLPTGVLPRAHVALDAGRMLVLGLLPPADTTVPERRWEQRAYVYDAASGRAQPLAAVDSLAARAARIAAQ